MSAPAGPCEWCGGRQVWTIVAGEMYVMCLEGCLPLPLEGLAPPPDSEIVACATTLWDEELQGEGGVKPLEGGEARMSDPDNSELGELPF